MHLLQMKRPLNNSKKTELALQLASNSTESKGNKRGKKCTSYDYKLILYDLIWYIADSTKQMFTQCLENIPWVKEEKS